MFRRVVFFVMVAMCSIVLTPAALAHTMLERSWPRANEAVAAAPTALRFQFSERIEPLLTRVTLTSAHGAAAVLGEPTLEAGNPRTLVIPLANVLVSGDYEVSWRVTSADGHASEGRFRFSVAP